MSQHKHTHTHKSKKYNNRNNMAERLSVRTQQLSNSTSSCFEYFVFACKKHAYIQTYMICIYIYIPKNSPDFMKRESLIFFFGLCTFSRFSVLWFFWFVRMARLSRKLQGPDPVSPSQTRTSTAFRWSVEQGLDSRELRYPTLGSWENIFKLDFSGDMLVPRTFIPMVLAIEIRCWRAISPKIVVAWGPTYCRG